MITPAQVSYFVDQFDGNIEPKMSAAFSSPPSRDGTGALLEQIAPGLFPKDYFKGPGGKIVTLIANFRDENYLDINFPSYVAGYHSSDINTFVNRNVMSIDSYDWAHRTGANPPNEPSTVICQNRPAQPFKYEGVFAHEYQHLLEFWASPGEATWANEGLSDYAITVTGYGFPARSIFETGYAATSSIPRLAAAADAREPDPTAERRRRELADASGTTRVGSRRSADYGAVYTFMEFLAGRYGQGVHDRPAQRLRERAPPGLQAVLDKYLTGDERRRTWSTTGPPWSRWTRRSTTAPSCAAPPRTPTSRRRV